MTATPQYPKAIQTSGHMGSTYFEHRYFIDNIEGNFRNTATVEEGFWAVLVGIAAERSIREGTPVHIKDMLL